MATGRDRERDRASRAQPLTSGRMNEYFVAKDGIDREVITADVCRYLGNDALVRPGFIDNPQTGQRQEGFLLKAYRNLTSAMIADLKADSERWEQERRLTASRGQASNVEYRSSQIHQARQYYGPTENNPPAAAVYQNATPSVGQGVYDTGPQYQSGPSYTQPSSAYPSTGYAQEPYYLAGSDLRATERSTGLPPAQGQGYIPRTGPQYASSTPTYQPADNRYYSSQPLPQVSSAQYPPSSAQYPNSSTQYPTSSSAQYASSSTQYAPSSNQYTTQNPQDPFNGRTAPTTGPYEASPDLYENRGYEEVAYTQSQMTPSSTATTSSSTARRDHDRDRERHHPRNRR